MSENGVGFSDGIRWEIQTRDQLPVRLSGAQAARTVRAAWRTSKR